jgi:hypothetical protein
MSFPLRSDPGPESEPIPEIFSGSRPAQKVPNPRIQIQSHNIHKKNEIYLPKVKQNNCAHIIFYFIFIEVGLRFFSDGGGGGRYALIPPKFSCLVHGADRSGFTERLFLWVVCISVHWSFPTNMEITWRKMKKTSLNKFLICN